MWKTLATYDQQYDYATAQRQGVGDLYVDLLLNADQLYGDGNGYLNKAEIMAYLDAAQLELDVKRLLFGMVSSAKNPYKTTKTPSCSEFPDGWELNVSIYGKFFLCHYCAISVPKCAKTCKLMQTKNHDTRIF